MIKRILCPVDFSEFTRETLNYAEEIAKRFSADLIVLHAIPNLNYYTPYESFIFPDSMLSVEKKIEEEAKKDMDNLIRDSEIPVKRLIKWGIPHMTILETIKEENIDLVVMATHGRGGIEHIIMGSVAEKVIRKSPCPVLIIRPKKTLERS